MELLVIVFILAILILPIKVAANYVGAQNTGIFSCIIALIFAAAIQKCVSHFLPQLAEQLPILDSIVALFLSAFAYMLVLVTTYIKGIIIALIQILLSLVLVFAIGLLGLGVSAVV